MGFDQSNPMKSVRQAWLNVLHGARSRRESFDEQYDEAMGFFTGNASWMWDKQAINGWYRGSDLPQPDCRITVNKTYEAVSIFGPNLYYQNPHRTVSTRNGVELPITAFGDPNDPNVQMYYQQLVQMAQQTSGPPMVRSKLMESYLNYTPNELGLVKHMRRCIDETMISGLSCVFTEVYKPPGSQVKLVGSFWETNRNILIDGDVDVIEDAMWIARRRIKPVWQIEQERGYPRGVIKGNCESLMEEARRKGTYDSSYMRESGRTNDCLEYWEVYSKMGMGDLMTQNEMPEALRGVFDQFGPYVFLEVSQGVEWPLNLPPWLTEQAVDPQAIFDAVQWPTPFWRDGRWPCAFLRWRDTIGELYPMGLIEPAIGELRGINWIASHLMDKVRVTSRDFVVTLKKAGKKIENAIKNGGSMTHIELDSSVGDDIRKVVQFLQHPQMQGDIWKVLQLWMSFFDKRTGLNEYMYGMNVGGVQSRSAQDAAGKKQASSIRPDDMARTVELFCTEAARMEAIGARWHLTGRDVAPALGPHGAMLWDQYISQAPIDVFLQESEYRIEADSARRPTKDTRTEQVAQAVQVWAPILERYAQGTGQMGPINALIAGWAETQDMDPKPLLMSAPAPPPPVAGPPPAGGPPPSRPSNAAPAAAGAPK